MEFDACYESYLFKENLLPAIKERPLYTHRIPHLIFNELSSAHSLF